MSLPEINGKVLAVTDGDVTLNFQSVLRMNQPEFNHDMKECRAESTLIQLYDYR